MKWMRNVGVMAAVVLVVACTSMPKALPVDTDASRSGAVGVSEITDAMLAVPRMELSKDETFFLPRGDDANALPTYPASLLARRLPPQTVCLRISVDELGGVLSTAPIEQAPDCPAASTFDPQFLAAAAQAASDWHFDPGVRCEYPHEAARMSGDCTGGRETPQAVSLSYRFVFEQNDGRGSVRSSTDAAPTR